MKPIFIVCLILSVILSKCESQNTKDSVFNKLLTDLKTSSQNLLNNVAAANVAANTNDKEAAKTAATQAEKNATAANDLIKTIKEDAENAKKAINSDTSKAPKPSTTTIDNAVAAVTDAVKAAQKAAESAKSSAQKKGSNDASAADTQTKTDTAAAQTAISKAVGATKALQTALFPTPTATPAPQISNAPPAPQISNASDISKLNQFLQYLQEFSNLISQLITILFQIFKSSVPSSKPVAPAITTQLPPIPQNAIFSRSQRSTNSQLVEFFKISLNTMNVLENLIVTRDETCLKLGICKVQELLHQMKVTMRTEEDSQLKGLLELFYMSSISMAPENLKNDLIFQENGNNCDLKYQCQRTLLSQ